MKVLIAKPSLGWQMTTIASLIDKLKKSNNLGKKVSDSCLIEYKGEIWELKKIK